MRCRVSQYRRRAGEPTRVEDIAPDALERTLAVNVESQFACAAQAVPLLRAAGGGPITGQAISVDADVQMMQ